MSANAVIHVYGASGSGTTTLGKYIAKQLEYVHIDTDDIFWLPIEPWYTQKRPVKERIALMRRQIEEAEGVVISGSLTDWGDVLIPYFTLAIRVVTDTELRLSRLKQREYEHFGDRIRPGGDRYDDHKEFLSWASQYDTGEVTMRSKACHDQWQKLLTCPILEVDGSRELTYNYAIVKNTIEKMHDKMEEQH